MTTTPIKRSRFIAFITQPKRQVISGILFLFAIILFDSFFYIFRPYDGMEVYQEAPLGEVYKIYPNGPADKVGFQVGDQILAIDNKRIDPVYNEPRYRAGIRAGDEVTYNIERQGNLITLPLIIGSYLENFPVLSSFLGVQLLSIGLWVIGLILGLFTQRNDQRPQLLSIAFLLAGLTVAVAGASGWNSFWGANTIQKVLMCLLAAVIIDVHLNFPTFSFSKYRRYIIYLGFVSSIILSLLVIGNDWIFAVHNYPLSVIYGNYLRRAVLIFFIISWLMAVGLLMRNRFLSRDPDIRRQTGIVIWGMVLGFGPFLAFTLLPYILFGQEYLAGSYTILFMMILPLAYAYVIFQRKLLKVDFIINRIVVWFTLILIILIVSILIFGLLVKALHLPTQLPIFGGLVAVLIALPFTSLSKIVQVSVDRVLYGSHYDFVTVTTSLSSRLAQPLNRKDLELLLTQQLPKQMGIQQADLYLPARNPLGSRSSYKSKISSSLGEELCQAVKKYHAPVRVEQLEEDKQPVDNKTILKDFDWVQVYAPMISDGKLQGILLLGQRSSGDVYSDEDLHIIGTVAEQGALASIKLELVETLRGMTQQLVRSEEEQRKQLANELHDTVLQDIFYIKYCIDKDPANPEIIEYLEQLIENLRRIIKTQHPPLLNQGLTLALEGLVDDMQKRVGSSISITWHSNLDVNFMINDERAPYIFRVALEALNNAFKHSHAQNIEVILEKDADCVIRLQVKDDGIGITEQDKEIKTDPNHFGWNLMQERATMIGAELKILTHLGEGTTIILEVQG